MKDYSNSRKIHNAYNENTTIRSNGMNENTELTLTDKQIIADKLVTTVLGALAAMVASGLVDKGYRSTITSYRLKKNPA